MHWKVNKPGYEEATGAFLVASRNYGLGVPLAEHGAIPPDMVFMRLGKEHSYFLDKYEVTNKQYKEFVDSGGYQNKTYWKHEILKEGQLLSWEEAMKIFVDKTGRPGPSTWELGDYPEGQDDYPVSGVSWYEAAACAEFIGKKLPTQVHWNRVFGYMDFLAGFIFPHGNLQGKGPAPVGRFMAISKYGAYDMAGNVKEWCWNTIQGDKKIILGGAWNELPYMAANVDYYPPIMRSSNFGFRCMKLLPEQEIPKNTLFPIQITSDSDMRQEKPCSDEEFVIYKRLYSYDKTELNPAIDQKQDISKSSFLETVSIDASYTNERINAHVFLPKNSSPPYQTIVYVLGDGALAINSIHEYGYEYPEYFTKDGRAVVVPALEGHLERSYKPRLSLEVMTTPTFLRDNQFKWYRELARVIDYLETREDIDSDRLAYMGISSSACWRLTLIGVEDRYRSAILLSGGLRGIKRSKDIPEVHPLNFLPRIKIPVIMLNGQYDTMFKLEQNQDPMYRLFGTPEEDKYHRIYDTGHNVWDRTEWVRDALAFLDKYFGPPKKAG